MKRVFLYAGTAALLSAIPLSAQVCTGSPDIGFIAGSQTINAPRNCGAGLYACHPPGVFGVNYRVLPGGCDPTEGSCTVRAEVPLEFPGKPSQHSGHLFRQPGEADLEGFHGRFRGSLRQRIRKNTG